MVKKTENPLFIVQGKKRDRGVASCVQKMSMLKAIAERNRENEAALRNSQSKQKNQGVL